MKAFDGYWRITWMQAWDQDFIDLVQPGYFRFDSDHGLFAFGALNAELDARYAEDGRRVEFSWTGTDEGDAISGRGWLALTNADTAEGRLFTHLGEESGMRLGRPG